MTIISADEVAVFRNFQFSEPSIHSYTIPLNRIVISSIKNNIIFIGYRASIAVARISASSRSKIIKRIINKENCRENDLRGVTLSGSAYIHMGLYVSIYSN